AIGSGISLPLKHVFNDSWQGSLAFWMLPAVITVFIWVPQLKEKLSSNTRQNPSTMTSLLRTPIAWQVTLFMGLQSFIFFVMTTWLPNILQAQGMSVVLSGWMLSICLFIEIPFTLFVPTLADKM